MANHEASGRRCKARALAWPVLLAVWVVAPAKALDEASSGSAVAARPAGAAAFTLGLDSALGAHPFRVPGPDARDAVAHPLRSTATIGFGDVRAFTTAMRQEAPKTPPVEPGKSDGSFGRWMKRHWWVPALIGAGVLVTAGESLYDDDDHDDED